jgi:hypothetical protein
MLILLMQKQHELPFSKGNSCGEYQGRVSASDPFVLALSQKQEFTVMILGSNPVNRVSIREPRGNLLNVNSEGNNAFSIITPRKGNYKVYVELPGSTSFATVKFCAYNLE